MDQLVSSMNEMVHLETLVLDEFLPAVDGPANPIRQGIKFKSLKKLSLTDSSRYVTQFLRHFDIKPVVKLTIGLWHSGNADRDFPNFDLFLTALAHSWHPQSFGGFHKLHYRHTPAQLRTYHTDIYHPLIEIDFLSHIEHPRKLHLAFRLPLECSWGVDYCFMKLCQDLNPTHLKTLVVDSTFCIQHDDVFAELFQPLKEIERVEVSDVGMTDSVEQMFLAAGHASWNFTKFPSLKTLEISGINFLERVWRYDGAGPADEVDGEPNGTALDWLTLAFKDRPEDFPPVHIKLSNCTGFTKEDGGVLQEQLGDRVAVEVIES